MTGDSGVRLLATDSYPTWRRRVREATSSVRIFTPYLDRLVVYLLTHSSLAVDALSVVTDLSPTSGALSYRSQLLAVRLLIKRGIEVRSLERLHAKVLLIDGEYATVGSQNFTSYARSSRETTAVPANGLAGSTFVATLQGWHRDAQPVDLELIEGLLDKLEEGMEAAQLAIKNLIAQYDEILAAHIAARRRVDEAQRRKHERQLARTRSTAEGIRRAANASSFIAGQSIAWARLEFDETWEYRTLLAEHGVDLTHWSSLEDYGFDRIHLDRLAFYPLLLSPNGHMAFVRVAKTRITYVWRGVRWGASHTIGGTRLHLRANFPDNQLDDANLVMTFGWDEGAATGYQLRLRFDGNSVVRVAKAKIVGKPWAPDVLSDAVEHTYENESAWNDVLAEVLSPARNPRDFRHEKNAETFFPNGWIRIDLIEFLDRAVLLAQPS